MHVWTVVRIAKLFTTELAIVLISLLYHAMLLHGWALVVWKDERPLGFLS